MVQVATEHTKTLERLTIVIERVAHSIRHSQDLEILFTSHEHVRSAVGALYADLIYFCARVVRFHTKTFRHAFISFDTEFGSICERINAHGLAIDHAANAAHMKESKKAREEMLAMNQGRACLFIVHGLSDYRHRPSIVSAPTLVISINCRRRFAQISEGLHGWILRLATHCDGVHEMAR